MIKKLMLALLFLPATVPALTIINNITGVGPTIVATPIPSAQVNTYMCVTDTTGIVTIAPGSSAVVYPSNPYYIGADLRYGGCSLTDSYIGTMGISLTNTGVNTTVPITISGVQGVHITANNLSATASGIITGQVAYTPISPNVGTNKTIYPPQENTSAWPFVGINLSGLEFGLIINPYVIPNLSNADTSTVYTDLPDTQLFINGGVNTVRIPISWDYLLWDSIPTSGSPPSTSGKPSTNQAFNNYYTYYLAPLLESLTSAQVYTIVDLHTYFRYSIYGTQYSGCGASAPCPNGTLNTTLADYEAVWGQLLNNMKNDPLIDMNYIMVDMINEPVTVPGDTVFTMQADLINYIRNTVGFEGYILIEGNCFSGLHSWATCTWTEGGTTYSNATLFTKENFAAKGVDTSKVIINVHQYFDSDYSGTSDICLQDLSTTGPGGFNLDSFVTWLNENHMHAMVTEFGSGSNATSCTPALQQFMQYMKTNSSNTIPYGFKGWTIWATGHGWDTYHLRVTPSSTCYQWNILKEFL